MRRVPATSSRRGPSSATGSTRVTSTAPTSRSTTSPYSRSTLRSICRARLRERCRSRPRARRSCRRSRRRWSASDSRAPAPRRTASLYRIEASLEEQGACGTYNAVVLCAVSATGSACSGDSGSGLIVASALVGIASTARNGCPAGGRVVYTNVAAPEILRFIQGEDAPPAAPHRLQSASLDVPPAMQVGQTVTCHPGVWTNEPTFTYRFLDHEDRRGPAAGAGSDLHAQARGRRENDPVRGRSDDRRRNGRRRQPGLREGGAGADDRSTRQWRPAPARARSCASRSRGWTR